MDEIHLEILRIQHLTHWAMVIIATEGVLSLLISAVAVFLARGTRATVREVARMADRMDERADRLGYYLFSKLGPADTK